MRRSSRRRRRRDGTPYVALDRSRCEACWRCLEACPKSVFGRIDLPGHRHVKVRSGEDCAGCGRCVKACEAGALTVRAPAVPRTRAEGADLGRPRAGDGGPGRGEPAQGQRPQVAARGATSPAARS